MKCEGHIRYGYAPICFKETKKDQRLVFPFQ